MAKRFVYTNDLDLDLLDQVVLINPWTSSWEKVAKAVRVAQPRFEAVTTKGMNDRCHLLMTKRKRDNAEELKASGIEGEAETGLTIALDEALLLREEAERENTEKKKSKAADSIEKAKLIRDAALGNLQKAQPSGSGEDEVPTMRRKRRGGVLEEYQAFRRQADEDRERRRSESEREEREFRRREAEEERELRREELDLRRQELALQAKRDAAFFELLLQKK
ncbi:hypothetical protein V1264_017772 [Littorina saxatilis]|uniref:Uncharacterized protein n=1 Tax=Littorina saxatilis TaxID=31220 RepID=A0AAN9BK96_9CAEN